MTTFVLVHGAWHGGWCWDPVRPLLEQRNHKVLTPTMIGVGERRHLMTKEITLDVLVDDISGVFEFANVSDAILVGHSFGGTVISGVAERVPDRIKQLVYLDAAILKNGESMFDCIPKEIADERIRLSEEQTGGMSLPPPSCVDLGILDEDQCKTIGPRLTPHPLSSYTSKIALTRMPGDGFPCAYIECTKPQYGPLSWARSRARGYGWPVIPIETGHDAMLSAPEALAAILLQIAVK